MVLCDVLCHGASFGPRGERSGPTVGAARCAHSRGSVRRPKPSRLLLPSLRANPPPPIPQPIPPSLFVPIAAARWSPLRRTGKPLPFSSLILFSLSCVFFSFLRSLFWYPAPTVEPPTLPLYPHSPPTPLPFILIRKVDTRENKLEASLPSPPTPPTPHQSTPVPSGPQRLNDRMKLDHRRNFATTQRVNKHLQVFPSPPPRSPIY